MNEFTQSREVTAHGHSDTVIAPVAPEEEPQVTDDEYERLLAALAERLVPPADEERLNGHLGTIDDVGSRLGLVIPKRAGGLKVNHCPTSPTELDESVTWYQQYAEYARRAGLMTDDEMQLRRSTLYKIDYRATGPFAAGYLLSPLSPVPVLDNGVARVVAPGFRKDRRAAEEDQLATLKDAFELSEQDMTRLHGYMDEVFRPGVINDRVRPIAYGNLGVRIGTGLNGKVEAYLGWEKINRSYDGRGCEVVSFYGVSIPVETALAYVAEAVQEFSAIAEAGKARIVSDEQLELKKRIALEAAEKNERDFLTQLRTAAPELSDIDDATMRRLMQVATQPGGRGDSGLEDYVLQAMFYGTGIMAAWDREASHMMVKDPVPWEERTYVIIDGVKSATLRHYSAKPSFVWGGKPVGDDEVLLSGDGGAEAITALRKQYFHMQVGEK